MRLRVVVASFLLAVGGPASCADGSDGVVSWDPGLELASESAEVARIAPSSADPQRRLEVDVVDPRMSDEQEDLLVFTLRLTNPTGNDIALDPCPTYRLYSDSTSDGLWAHLPCEEAPTVEGHGHVDFAMQVKSPLNVDSNEIFLGLWEGTPASGFAWVHGDVFSEDLRTRADDCAEFESGVEFEHPPKSCP